MNTGSCIAPYSLEGLGENDTETISGIHTWYVRGQGGSGNCNNMHQQMPTCEACAIPRPSLCSYGSNTFEASSDFRFWNGVPPCLRSSEFIMVLPSGQESRNMTVEARKVMDLYGYDARIVVSRDYCGTEVFLSDIVSLNHLAGRRETSARQY
eukprot:1144749-Pelagomonas_calceolata.AAC.2